MKRLFSLFNVIGAALFALSLFALQAVQKVPPSPPAPQINLIERSPMQVKVYFTGPEVEKMVVETHTIQIAQKTPGAIAQAALNVWAAGPSVKGNIGALPKGTVSPKVYVRGTHYYVDLPASYTKLRYGTSGERMLLCTITRTMLDKQGEDVTFLVNGQNTDALGHLDLREPFTRTDCTDE